MRAAAPERLAELVRPALEAHTGQALSAAEAEALAALMPELTQRAKDLHALAQAARAVLPPASYDDKAASLLRDGRDALAATAAALEGADFTREGLENALNAVAADLGVKFNIVGGPLRAALTGTTASPSLFALMAAIGREETLGRVRAALQHER
jgi:glutamyl-tRNA synthetase